MQLTAFIFHSLYKISKPFLFPVFCLGCISAFVISVGLQNHKPNESKWDWSLSWAQRGLFSLPPPDFSQTSFQVTEILPPHFFLTTSKVLSPWFSESYPFLNFTLNHRGGEGIAEVRKYRKYANNLPLKYTLRIFSASIISALNF